MSENNVSNLTAEELSKTPLKELLALQVMLSSAIDDRKEKERIELLDKFKTLASESGFSLSELMAEKPVKKAPSAVKYRNPSNKDEGWTGKGRKPKWLVDLLDAGRKLEEFEVK